MKRYQPINEEDAERLELTVKQYKSDGGCYWTEFYAYDGWLVHSEVSVTKFGQRLYFGKHLKKASEKLHRKLLFLSGVEVDNAPQTFKVRAR